MAAEIIKGKPVADEIREEIKKETQRLKDKGVDPKLAVVLVGDDPASVVYARSKEKVGDKLGVTVDLTVLATDTPENDVLDLIKKLNDDSSVHGILVELPLPKQIRKEQVMLTVHHNKDVDGISPINRGFLLGGQEDLALVPATPMSCIELMERAGITIRGKRVVLVGRGDTVGRPLASLLIKRDATITVCHTKTVDLPSVTRQAEVLVAAAGRRGLVTADMVSEGTVVIDAGINQTENGITGDVDFEAVKEKAAAITPVPGGVGSLTTTIIMNNVLKAIRLQGLL